MADNTDFLDGYALSLGVLMNISMSVYCTAAALAEEKEKNTLRTLMTKGHLGSGDYKIEITSIDYIKPVLDFLEEEVF